MLNKSLTNKTLQKRDIKKSEIDSLIQYELDNYGEYSIEYKNELTYSFNNESSFICYDVPNEGVFIVCVCINSFENYFNTKHGFVEEKISFDKGVSEYFIFKEDNRVENARGWDLIVLDNRLLTEKTLDITFYHNEYKEHDKWDETWDENANIDIYADIDDIDI